MPQESFDKILHGVGYLLRSAGNTVSVSDAQFYGLLDRVVQARSSSAWEATDDVVGKAINDPVGQAIQGAFDFWYRTKPSVGAGLAPAPLRDLFSRIALAPAGALLGGLVILASNLNSLFLVDKAWTEERLLPAFEWARGEDRARAAWEGYLWNPRLARELFVSLKRSYLETAAQFEQLTKHGEQYVGLLVWTALEYPDLLSTGELRAALHLVPAEALSSGVQVLTTVLEGAGDRAAELWQSRVSPILISAWPKSVNRRTPEQSTWLGQLCASAGAGFPDAVATIIPLASATRNNVVAFQMILQRDLAKKYPADALKLLKRLVDTEETFVTDDLPRLLEEIGSAQPRLRELAAFKHLREFAAAHRL
jgi:hypothetical protein